VCLPDCSKSAAFVLDRELHSTERRRQQLDFKNMLAAALESKKTSKTQSA
jgi:hypothetical protein